MANESNAIGLPINSSNPLSTLNGGIGRSVTPSSGAVLFYDSTGVQQNSPNFSWDNSFFNLTVANSFIGKNFIGSPSNDVYFYTTAGGL